MDYCSQLANGFELDRCFQVVVGRVGREPSVFPRAVHGEMVKACVVREAHQFSHGIVEETADAGSLASGACSRGQAHAATATSRKPFKWKARVG